MKRLPIFTLVDRIENDASLDPVVAKVKKSVNAVIRPQWLRDILHGVPIGHALHPLMVQVPLGAWISAAVLDAMPGTDRAARALVGTGIITVLPAAASGYIDWSKLHEQQMRVGIVHSGANIIATTLYLASYVQRRRGKQASGKVLSFAGLAVVSAAGYLGGHLSYSQASAVNHTEDVPHRFPEGWHPLALLHDLKDGQLDRRIVAETPLVIFRRGTSVDVLSDVCSHLSGPLNEGVLIDGDDPCVVCPWHQSVFSLRTGEVVHGPATNAQPRFFTRITDGTVEVSLPGAG